MLNKQVRQLQAECKVLTNKVNQQEIELYCLASDRNTSRLKCEYYSSLLQSHHLPFDD